MLCIAGLGCSASQAQGACGVILAVKTFQALYVLIVGPHRSLMATATFFCITVLEAAYVSVLMAAQDDPLSANGNAVCMHQIAKQSMQSVLVEEYNPAFMHAAAS